MTRTHANTTHGGARGLRAPDPCVTRLGFADLSHAVELHGADALRDTLATVLPDWGCAISRANLAPGTPVTRVRCDDGEYGFQSWWATAPLTKLGVAGATCGVVADLVQAYLDARPGVFGLHCGAVRLGGQLVAFTGPYRAGKTTLVTRLGTEPGCELFCDDVLPIAPDGMAVALGVQPRLRLPLPDTMPDGFRAFVGRNLTVHDQRYGYVALPGQAAFGTRAPLAALILLSRQPGAKARFHRLDTSEAAAHLIRQNIADPGEVEAHYDRVSALAEGMVCLTLVYSDLEDAVALVRTAFDGTPQAPRIADPGPPLDRTAAQEDADPADMDLVFRRSGDVVERVIGSDTFLWQMDGRHFFSLNPVGGAVWTLLETPASGHDIAAALHTAFPDVPRAVIAGDTARLLGQMHRRGLLTA